MAYAPAADIIKNIEKLVVVGTVANSTVDLAEISGLTDFTFGAGSAFGLTVTNLDAATAVHITASNGLATPLTLGYVTAPTTAEISIDANFGGIIDFSDAAVKAVTANVTVAASAVRFSDVDLETVTVTSKGNVQLDTIGAGLKTLDLSGVGTYSVSNLTGNAFTENVTATLGAGADVFQIDANLAHSVTLGAEADTVEFNAAGNVTAAVIADAAKLAAGVAVVTDFSVAQADILVLDGLGATRATLNSTDLGQIKGSLDILEAATKAGVFTDAGADSWAIFNFGADTYALFDSANDGFTAGDTLIKVTGIQVADLTATNFSII